MDRIIEDFSIGFKQLMILIKYLTYLSV